MYAIRDYRDAALQLLHCCVLLLGRSRCAGRHDTAARMTICIDQN
jgi:hypothetical protein